MLYFAYGSNMSRPRLEARVGKVRVEAPATLPGQRLTFSKVGRDGSGKCCFEPAEHQEVHGVIFGLADHELEVLDRFEGVGNGYRRVEIPVLAEDRVETEVVTYEATHRDPALRPFSWYVQHVLYGAVEAGFAQSYIAKIRKTRTVADPQLSRVDRELAIYGSCRGV